MNRRRFLNSAAAAVAFAGQPAVPGAESIARNESAARKVLSEIEAKPNYLGVAPKEGQFLNMLVKATRARNVLEIGTSYGYASLWLSVALAETDGKLTTIEIQPERVKVAKAHLAKAGLSERVTFHLADAHELVPNLEGSFDFAYIDADKDGLTDYLKKLHPRKLSPHALVIAQGTIRAADSLKKYLEVISAHPDFDAVTLSVVPEDGFSVAYRKR